jgi:flagellar hook-basal body complex protein FliE
MGPISPTGLTSIQHEVFREAGFAKPNAQPAGADFSGVLGDLVGSANESARLADGKSQAFAAGARDDIHGTMIAISKADIELHLVGTVRNKVIDAFYELWRMQI